MKDERKGEEVRKGKWEYDGDGREEGAVAWYRVGRVKV